MNNVAALSYLIRWEPYTSIFIRQNQRLDHPNRMFSDMEESKLLLDMANFNSLE